MEPLQQSEPDRTIYDEKNRDDQVQEARHDQDEHARKQRQDRRDVGDGDVHEFSFRGWANRGGIIADWVPGVETHRGAREFPASRKLPENAAYAASVFRNIAKTHALATGRASGASRTFSKELPMRNRILALAALAAAIGSPLAAQAQSSVTVGRAPVVVESGPTIAVEQRPAFRDYVVEQRVPAFRIPDRVVVGATLPESGVTYYDVPQRFGATTYRYTVVNGETVLVEPRSRRIVEVMD
jgi:hypothetical protein